MTANTKHKTRGSALTPTDAPPVFKKWGHWYGLLLVALVVQIILYLWLTLAFA